MSELSTIVRMRNFIRVCQEHLLDEHGNHLYNRERLLALSCAENVEEELEQSERDLNTRIRMRNFIRSCLERLHKHRDHLPVNELELTDVGMNLYHDCEDNRFQLYTQNTRSVRQSAQLDVVPSGHFNRKRLGDLSSVQDLVEEMDLSETDLILTSDCVVVEIFSETGETIGTFATLNGAETDL